jgi:hypothetical protein
MSQIETSQYQAAAVGSFYHAANSYIDKFKIGGNQKLQKIVGKELFYKKGKDWWFSYKIAHMNISELRNLTKKIQDKANNLNSSKLKKNKIAHKWWDSLNENQQIKLMIKYDTESFDPRTVKVSEMLEMYEKEYIVDFVI